MLKRRSETHGEEQPEQASGVVGRLVVGIGCRSRIDIQIISQGFVLMELLEPFRAKSRRGLIDMLEAHLKAELMTIDRWINFEIIKMRTVNGLLQLADMTLC